MLKKSILITARPSILPPRVKMEKETLEEFGADVFVSHRSPFFSGRWFIITWPAYYISILITAVKLQITTIHFTHISQLFISPLLKLRKTKIIYDVMERYSIDISERYVPSIFKKFVKHLIESMENFIVSEFIDGVLAVSTPKNYLSNRYTKHCSNAVCINNVPSISDIFQGDISSKFKDPVLKIAYAGSLSYEKGAVRIFNLAKKLQSQKVPFEMHFMGEYRSDKIRIDELIKNLSLEGQTFFHGFLPYSEMMKVLYTCHIGLNLYSRSKRLIHVGIGSSRKNFSYLAAGMVLLATDIGEIAEITKRIKCGYAIKDPDDLDHLSSIIEEIHQNRNLAIQMAKAGVKAIEQEYNWEKEKNKIITVYKNVLEDK